MKPFSLLKDRLARLSGRSRTVGVFFVTSLTSRVIGISCQLLQVPIAMQALGPEAFGLWMTLTGIGTLILFSDFGVGQGAQNKLAEAFAAGDEAQARNLWGSTLVFFGAVGLVLLAAAAVLSQTLDFTVLFNLSDPVVRADARGAVTVTLFLYCLNFPLGLAQRLAYSRQLGWMHNIVQATTGAGSLAGTWLAIHLHWPLAGIIAAAHLPLLAGNAILLAVLLRQLGWLRLRGWHCHWATMRELLQLGAYFGIQQVQLTILLGLPQIIISTSLGAAAVTPYNLAQRLFNLFAVIQNAFMLPLWPAYTDAKARGEFAWIRRTLFVSLAATVGCTLIPMAVGATLAQPVLTWWVGRNAVLPTTALVWLLFSWNAVVFLQQPFGYLLAGLSEVRRSTVFAVISTVACAILMRVLVKPYGLDGVVLGLIVGYLPFLIFGNVLEIGRVFRSLPTQNTAPGLVPATAARSQP